MKHDDQQAPTPPRDDPDRRYLRSVIDAIPHFIFARDTAGRFTLVNRAVADFYGMSVDEIEGRHLRDIHPDSEQAELWLAEDRKTLELGEQWQQATTAATDSDGQAIWISAIKKPLPAELDGVTQVLGVSIDQTDQLQAEQALSRRLDYEHTAAALFQTFVHCGVEDLDQVMDRTLARLGRFTGVSRTFLYQMAGPRSDLRLLYRWTRPDIGDERNLPRSLRRADLDWLLSLFEMKVPVTSENLAQHTAIPAAFVDIWGEGDVAFAAAPILHHGELIGFLGMDVVGCRAWRQEDVNLLHTMTDLFVTVWSKNQAERSLVEAMEAARASAKAKGEFLANMSHEIRTPMNCVIGLADLLSDMEPTPRQRQYLDMIRMSGASLLTLINDVLDLSKIEAGQLELDPLPTNLQELVNEVSGMIAFGAQSRGLEMVCRLAPGVPRRVLIDAGRLRQVLTNLLNNAAKFTHEGHIYLNVEPVGGTDDQMDLLFQVMDTGIGIAPENLENIFDKFTQAEAGTTRRYGGTGLGLSISQHLVSLMGGRINAVSEPNRGSTFSFTVRVSVLDTTEPALVHGDDRRRALVVTGTELTGEVLLEQLRSLGHNGRMIVGGPEALDQVAGWASADEPPYDLVFFNQNAFDDTVPDLRPYLQRMAPRHLPQVVLMTNLSSLVQDQELQQKGFVGTLPKPVAPARLAAVLDGDLDLTVVSAAVIETGGDPDSLAAMDPGDEDEDDGPRVLLAEDNPFNQKVAVAMLKLLGCRVEVAPTGAEAVSLAAQGTYALVLMDCQMPIMDGYEATRRIRELPAPAAEVTIIAMTANALSGDREACFAAGMDDFLSKPITKAMLQEMLAKWEITLPDGSASVRS